MNRALFDFAFEGFKLYVVLSFLAWATAIPHAVAHWAFPFLVSIAFFPGWMAGAQRSPKAGQPS